MSVDQCFMYPGARARLREMFEADAQKRRVERELRNIIKPRHQWQFGEQHWLGRLEQEKAMRDGEVRHPPSIFNIFAEEPQHDL